MSLWMGAWLLGVVLGFRHAFEPDHLAAVVTLAAERRGRRGTLWHTLSLLAVAALLSCLERTLSPRLESAFELGVAVLLCGLGARSLLAAAREGRSGKVHAHRGSTRHLHLGRGVFSIRPLVTGLVHGLAGSGAMTALAMSAMPTLCSRLGYVALFGAGSLFGMAALTGLLGLPLERLRGRPAAQRGLQACAGGLALLLGCYWGLTSGAGVFR